MQTMGGRLVVGTAIGVLLGVSVYSFVTSPQTSLPLLVLIALAPRIEGGDTMSRLSSWKT